MRTRMETLETTQRRTHDEWDDNAKEESSEEEEEEKMKLSELLRFW